MITALRHVGQMTLSMVLCGFLLFAPLAAQAQTIAGTALLDDWRSGFNHELDDEIGRLTSAHRFVTLSAPSVEQREQNNSSSLTDALHGLKGRRAEHWPAVVKDILQSQGLPPNLIGVAAVESGFNPTALSPKGAAGMWQFMPDTARQYGLVVNANQDDRFDVFKSTVAASHYLRVLHDQFGDWPLALAAYNAGPNRVGQGLDRLNAGNFWALSRNLALPNETRDYVPKVLAAMRGGLTGQNLEPQHRTSWNRSEETLWFHSMYPNREGGIVFATTTPEALLSQGAK